MDQNLPECHKLLGSIFVSIFWEKWVVSVSENTSVATKTKISWCLLHLFTKLSSEPYIKANYLKRMEVLLVEAEKFDWGLLEPVAYQQVMDWYLMSCDPQVILKSDPLDLDVRVLRYF